MDWKAMLSQVIVALLTMIMVGVPTQFWLDARRKREQEQVPVKCPGCGVRAPGWFMEPHDTHDSRYETLCGFCKRKTHRRPRLDEGSAAYWRSIKKDEKLFAKAVERQRATGRVISTDEPSKDPEQTLPTDKDAD